MRRLCIVVAACLCMGPPALASPTVQCTGVYGWEVNILTPWYDGPMTAGIYRLLLDGTPADAFCIDPAESDPVFPEPYAAVNLANAPDPPVGPMGIQKAEVVRKLWAMAYDPGMTKDQAAALQVAIWDTVVDLDYSVYDGDFQIDGYEYGAQSLLNNVQNYTGPLADLMGLTNMQYQDFVTPAVPVPGALWLGCFGMGLVGRRRLNRR